MPDWSKPFASAADAAPRPRAGDAGADSLAWGPDVLLALCYISIPLSILLALHKVTKVHLAWLPAGSALFLLFAGLAHGLAPLATVAPDTFPANLQAVMKVVCAIAGLALAASLPSKAPGVIALLESAGSARAREVELERARASLAEAYEEIHALRKHIEATQAAHASSPPRPPRPPPLPWPRLRSTTSPRSKRGSPSCSWSRSSFVPRFQWSWDGSRSFARAPIRRNGCPRSSPRWNARANAFWIWWGSSATPPSSPVGACGWSRRPSRSTPSSRASCGARSRAPRPGTKSSSGRVRNLLASCGAIPSGSRACSRNASATPSNSRREEATCASPSRGGANSRWCASRTRAPGFRPSASRAFATGHCRSTSILPRAWGSGVGLGLQVANAKALIERHGGTLSFTEPGVGFVTAVEVALPLLAIRLPMPGPASVESASSFPPVADLPGVRVLFVGPVNAAVEHHCAVLTAHGADVQRCENTFEVGRALRTRTFDVVVTDTGKPLEKEVVVLAHVEASNGKRTSARMGGAAAPAIIALTETVLSMPTPFPRPDTRFARRRFHDVLVEPVAADALIASVRRVLSERKTRH